MAYCSNCGKEVSEGLTRCEDCAPAGIQDQGKQFFASLFDFSMKEMITPKIIRILFIIGLVAIGLVSVISLFSSFSAARFGGAGVVVGALIGIPIFALISVIFLRVYLEIIMLLFNIYDELKKIRQS